MTDIIERLQERLTEADEANKRVSDENERLRKVLRPFAETDTEFYAGENDYYVCTAVWFSIGQYRAAKAALEDK